MADRDIVHRTERGLVRVGVGTTEEVRSAVAAFARELGRPDSPVLVQPMVEGTELAVGVVRDPSFGPLVMVGAGGVDTDVLADRTYMLPPSTRVTYGAPCAGCGAGRSWRGSAVHLAPTSMPSSSWSSRWAGWSGTFPRSPSST